MSSNLHPALRALGLGIGGLALLVIGSLAAVKGLTALARAGEPKRPAPVAATPSQENSADPAATMKRALSLAKASHGDWERLSVDDQRLLDSVTGGRGREMLRSLAQKQAARKLYRNN